MITKNQKLINCYFLIQSLFLGWGFTFIFNITGKDAWISIILGILIGTFIIYLISKILDYKQNKTINNVFDEMKFGFLFKIIFILLAIYFIFNGFLIIQTFATSFFLLNTPAIFINIPGAILALMAISKEKSTIFKVAESLIFICIVIFVLNNLLLIPYNKIDSFLPVLTTTPFNIFKGALSFAALSTGPMLLIMNNQDNKKGYVIVYIVISFLLLLVCLETTSVLGANLINVYRFPEYVVLKKISFLKFVERIENIVSIIWIFNIFMLLTNASQVLKDTLPKKGLKFSLPILVIGIAILTGYIFGNNYIFDLESFYLTPHILWIFIIILVIPIFIFCYFKYKKKKPN